MLLSSRGASSSSFSSSWLLLPSCLVGLSVALILQRTLSSKNDDDEDNLPPFGVSIEEYGEAVTTGCVMKDQLEWCDKYGSVFRCKMFFPLNLLLPRQIVVADPEVARQLLIKETNQGRKPYRFTTRDEDFAKMIYRGLGDSITGHVGEEWRWRRDALLKAFHKKRLRQPTLLQAMLDTANEFCDSIQEAIDDKNNKGNEEERSAVVRVDQLTTRVAVRVILNFLFGKDVPHDPQVLHENVQDMVGFVVHLFMTPWHFFMKYVPNSYCYIKEARRVAAWDSMANTVRQELVDSVVAPSSSKNQRDSAVSRMIQQEPRFLTKSGGRSLEALIADVRLFMLAGFETTAHTMAFAVGILAQRPDIGDRIAKEFQEAIGDGEENVTFEVLQKCPTAKGLVMETLRLYPPVPILPGKVTDHGVVATTSDGRRFSFPKNSQVMFCIGAMHRAPHSIDGDEVNVDRWLQKKPDQLPFFGVFGLGPHQCPGRPLTILEAHVVLLVAASKFRFSFAPKDESKIDFEKSIFLIPKDGLPVVAEPREE